MGGVAGTLPVPPSGPRADVSSHPASTGFPHTRLGKTPCRRGLHTAKTWVSKWQQRALGRPGVSCNPRCSHIL